MRNTLRRFIPRGDIPFHREEGQKLLPIMIAVMLCVALLLLMAASAIQQMVAQRASDVSTHFFIEISADQNVDTTMMENLIAAIETQNGVASARLIDRDTQQGYLTPWLGEGMDASLLSLPYLVEVERSDIAIEWGALTEILKETGLTSHIDREQPWLASMQEVAAIAYSVGLILALLLVVAIVVTIVLATHTSLKLHAKSIYILHRLGAEDLYIMKQFLWQGLRLSGVGSLIGTCIAIIFGLMASALLAANRDILPFEITMSSTQWSIAIALPLFVIILSLAVTWQAVMYQLRKIH